MQQIDVGDKGSDSAIRRRKKRKKIFEQPQSCSKANSYPKIRFMKSKLTETASTAHIFSFSLSSAVHCGDAPLLTIKPAAHTAVRMPQAIRVISMTNEP